MIPFPLMFDPPEGWDLVSSSPNPGTVTLAPMGTAPASGFRPRIGIDGSVGDTEELPEAAGRLVTSMRAAASSVRLLDLEVVADPPAPMVLQVAEVVVPSRAGDEQTLRHVDYLLEVAGPDAPDGGRRRLHLTLTADEREFTEALRAFESLLDTLEVDD